MGGIHEEGDVVLGVEGLEEQNQMVLHFVHVLGLLIVLLFLHVSAHLSQDPGTSRQQLGRLEIIPLLLSLQPDALVLLQLCFPLFELFLFLA